MADSYLTEESWNSAENMEAIEAAYGRNASEYLRTVNWTFVNRTVIPYLLNRTLEVDRVPHFVKVVRDSQSVQVHIASPSTIASVYLLLYVPVIMAWVAMKHYGTEKKHYLILLPVVLCTTHIGLDLVNQSLSVLMNSPNTLTAIQALSMTILAGSWAAADEVLVERRVTLAMSRPLMRWSMVALLFSVFQVLNHYVFTFCSLSERTVFMNLCPLLSVICETGLLPARAQKQVTFSGKMALVGMTFGAVLFALQYPNFTVKGAVSALSMVLIVIPYRLLQRWLLVECRELPAALLCSYDGLVLLVPSSILMFLSQDELGTMLAEWLGNPSIVMMMVLSWLTFTVNHTFVLMLLKETSATSAIVFNNLANFVVVFEGVLFFGDRITDNPLVLTGIVISLASGLWYSVQMQPTQMLRRTESVDKGVGDCTLSDYVEKHPSNEAEGMPATKAA